MSGDVVARAWRVVGRVQGVGFRWHTVQEARSLGLRGRVANRPDGSVEVQASGPGAKLEALRRWLSTGPPAAKVDAVEEIEAGPESAAEGFHAVV